MLFFIGLWEAEEPVQANGAFASQWEQQKQDRDTWNIYDLCAQMTSLQRQNRFRLRDL